MILVIARKILNLSSTNRKKNFREMFKLLFKKKIISTIFNDNEEHETIMKNLKIIIKSQYSFI